MSKGLVVFDIDGTLFRGDIVSIEAFKQVLAEFSLPAMSEAEICGFLGDDPETTWRKLGISGELALRFSARLDEAEGARVALSRLYDGAAAMMDGLKADGFTLALCSSGTQMYVSGVADCHGLARRCGHIRWARPGVSKGQLLAEIIEEAGRPGFCVMVGDRAYDMQAASDCGVPFIAAEYGFAPGEVADAQLRARSPAEIAGVVRRLYGERGGE